MSTNLIPEKFFIYTDESKTNISMPLTVVNCKKSRLSENNIEVVKRAAMHIILNSQEIE
ncbi:MAG: hypothetical protein WCO13_00715 [Bacteroidota bacterium]